MPSDIQDFINTFMGLKQLQNQTQQVALQAKEQALQGVNAFMQIARQTAHPGELAALTDRFAELGVGSREQLSSLLMNVTPTPEALKAAQAQFGINIAAGDKSGTEASRQLAQDTASAELTGQSTTQRTIGRRQATAVESQPTGTPFGDFLNKAFASQTLAGMSPGKATIDALVLGLPTPELQQAAGVASGTRLSAEGNAQVQIAKSRNDIEWAQLANTSAFQAAQLGMDEVKLKMMMKKAQAGGLDPNDFVQLITAKTALVKAAQDAKNKNPSDTELSAIVGGLNAINARMAAVGLPHEPPIENSPDVLRSNADRMWNSWMKKLTVK